MRIWVGVTDKDWFEFLAARDVDEVNFWQPSSKQAFRALNIGEPFLFKLHSPLNFIVGGGFFLRHTPLLSSLAWDAFGEKNGVESLQALQARVSKYRKHEEKDPEIGCNILVEPFFFDRDQWIPIPSDWAPNIVRGKTYDTEDEIGARLWDSVMAAGVGSKRIREPEMEGEQDGDRFGEPYLARARLGQGSFRVLVTDAYKRRCAISGERTLPVLQAAHIWPYAIGGPHRISNGILMRSDMHTLFDAGYMTISPELRVEVSRDLKEEWQNGKEYYRYHGQPMNVVPANPDEVPSKEYLGWHNGEVFRG